jgi:hypothetical protein
LDDSDYHEAHSCVLASDCSNIVQPTERKPVVNPEEKNLKRLQRQQAQFSHDSILGPVICMVPESLLDDTSALISAESMSPPYLPHHVDEGLPSAVPLCYSSRWN